MKTVRVDHTVALEIAAAKHTHVGAQITVPGVFVNVLPDGFTFHGKLLNRSTLDDLIHRQFVKPVQRHPA